MLTIIPIKAHNAVSVGTREDFPSPVTPSAVMLANEVIYDAENGTSAEEVELAELLSSPHVSALLTSHDRVANKEWPLHPVSEGGKGVGEVVEMTGPVRVVQVEKGKEPLVCRALLQNVQSDFKCENGNLHRVLQ